MKPLYTYQQVIDEQALRLLCGGHRDVLMHAPCGSGKTTMVQVLVALLGRRGGFRRFKGYHTIVIFAPSTTLVESWLTEADQPERYLFRREYGPLEFVSERLSRQDWDGFFRRSFRSQHKVYVCTRAMLTNAFLSALREVEGSKALEGFLFVGDEGHHLATEAEEQAGNRGGELVSRVLAHGGSVLNVTATPWNTSGQIIRPETAIIALSLAAYQQQIDPVTGRPFCPRRWEFQPVITKHRSTDPDLAVDLPRRRNATTGELDETQEVAPPRARFAVDAALAYVDKWVEDACPVAVMRTLTVEAGRRLVAKLKASRKVKAVLKHPPRVLDLCGEMTPEAKRAAVEALERDARVDNYNQRQYDVYVGVSRLDEGTDTKLACCVYMTGIPGSLGYLVQLINRAGRGKWRVKDYPEQWCDRQRLYMFLPRLSQEAQDSVLERYSDVPLAAAIIVQSLELGLQIFNPSATPPRMGRRRVESELTEAQLEAAVAESEHRAAWEGDLVAGAQVFAKVLKRIARRGDKLSIGEVAEIIDEAGAKLSEHERYNLMCRVRDHLRVSRPDFAAEWDAHEKASRKRSRSGRMRTPSLIRAEMFEAWRAFVKQHGHEVCPPFEKLLTHAASFTGNTCERMVGAWPEQSSPVERCREVDQWVVKNKRQPSQCAVKGSEEKGMYHKLHNLRCNHPEIIAKFPRLQATTPLGRCREVDQWVVKNKRQPSHTAAKGSEEKGMYHKLHNLRCNHPEIVAKFSRLRATTPAPLERCREVDQWVVKNKRQPSHTAAKGSEEKGMYHKLRNLRGHHPEIVAKFSRLQAGR